MNREKLNFWAKVALFFIAYTILMSWIQEQDSKAALAEAYADGVAQGIAIEEKVQLARDESKALRWWVGSQDMNEVRQRLCHNYNRPQVK